MRLEFTPASRRVLNTAQGWTTAPASDAADGDSPSIDDVGAVEILLGLVSEPEYRAAGLLAARGIDEAAVRARWPGLRPLLAPQAVAAANGSIVDDAVAGALRRDLAPRLLSGLADVLERFDFERNTPLATEHLLLALAVANDDVAAWLTARNVSSAALAADICARYGINPTPLVVDDGVATPSTTTTAPTADAPTEPQSGEDRAMPSEPAAQSPDVDRPSTGSDPDRPARLAELRVLDAAANRAGEAVRVVEDYTRFVLDDALLTRTCKELRHALAAALQALPEAQRLAARDTLQDVGTSIAAPGEYDRRDAADVVGANLRRLQEALRSLEEFSKTSLPELAVECERLRYRSYTLHKAVLGTARSRARLADRRLYVLVDGCESEAMFEEQVAALVAAGVDVLQLRDKHLDDRALLKRARTLRRLTRASRTLFVMNDRPDLAYLAEADGVHVGQEELSVGEARRIVGPDRLVGVSTHDLEQARRAVFDGADYLGVGPTFPSGTKQFARFPGLAFVEAVAREITLPSFAIGGITAENVGKVLGAGLRRIAVGGAVVKSPDPAAAAKQLRTALRSSG